MMKPVNLELMIDLEMYDRVFKCINCGYYWDDHRVSIVTHKEPTLTCPRYKPSELVLWTPASTAFQNSNNENP